MKGNRSSELKHKDSEASKSTNKGGGNNPVGSHIIEGQIGGVLKHLMPAIASTTRMLT